MTDEPRDDERPPPDPPEGDDAPPPATWAGRKRAGAGEGEEPADSPGEGQGMTDEFDGLEAELSAGFDEIGTDEHDSDDDAGSEGADEEEEPPDEFEFSDEDEEPEEGADTEAEEEPLAGHPTREADTLSIADREAEREAAHAGLRARVERSTSAHETTAPPAPAPKQEEPATAQTGAPAAAATPTPAAPAVAGAGEAPKRTVWWRFLAASFVIVGAVAAATSIAFLLYLTDIGDALGDEGFSEDVTPSLATVEGGDPQTILILGSDKRSNTPGDPGRSDTTMLLRVDPDKGFLALLSLPRDLEVQIPGYGPPQKLNAAYSLGEQHEADDGGGPKLTLKTVKELLGIDIAHIVNVDFEGFYDAINAIGCVYVDIDRHYYNPPETGFDDIDIKPGYTKLCGYRALDYARYRHGDNDLVRGARQQGFIREARQQIPPRDLLPFLPGSNGDELIDIFAKHTTSDINKPETIIDMLRSFASVRSAQVRQVSLGELTADGGVDASKRDVKTAVDQFLGNDLDESEPESPPEEGPRDEQPKNDKKKEEKEQDDPGSGPAMVDVAATAEEYAVEFERRLDRRRARLPVFYPTQVVANEIAAITPESRSHPIEHPNGNPDDAYYGYKFVISHQESFGASYYGVAGINWLDAPILNNPSETREIDGRQYMLFYEQDRLRLVGWKTKRGSYWVNNTLTRTLSEEEMLAVATSTRELGA